jgi:hypothetical protein
VDGPALSATPTACRPFKPLGLAVNWLTSSSKRYAYIGNASACIPAQLKTHNSLFSGFPAYATRLKAYGFVLCPILHST